jgi:hypothetical protein
MTKSTSAQYDVETVQKLMRRQTSWSSAEALSPYTRQSLSDCYINLPLIALASSWRNIAGFAETTHTLGQWTQEKPPCLCPDLNEYECDAIPTTFSASECFENRLYGELARMRRDASHTNELSSSI